MLIAVPLGVPDRHGRCPVIAPVSWLVLALVGGVYAIEAATPLVPDAWWGWWGDLLAALARWPLASSAGGRDFSPLQMWSHAAIHRDPVGLVVMLLGWWVLAPAVERRLGSLVFLVLLTVVVPLGISIHLLVGRPVPPIGLGAVLVALIGAAHGGEAPLRLRWLAAWWLGVRLGAGVLVHRLRWFTLALTALILLHLGWLVLLSPPNPGTVGIGPGFLVVHVVQLAVVFLGGYVIAQSLAQLRDRYLPPGDAAAAALVAGERDLDDFPGLRAAGLRFSSEDLHQLAARCMREHRPEVARALLAELQARDPGDPAALQLGRWLRAIGRGQDEAR